MLSVPRLIRPRSRTMSHIANSGDRWKFHFSPAYDQSRKVRLKLRNLVIQDMSRPTGEVLPGVAAADSLTGIKFQILKERAVNFSAMTRRPSAVPFCFLRPQSLQSGPATPWAAAGDTLLRGNGKTQGRCFRTTDSGRPVGRRWGSVTASEKASSERGIRIGKDRQPYPRSGSRKVTLIEDESSSMSAPASALASPVMDGPPVASADSGATNRKHRAGLLPFFEDRMAYEAQAHVARVNWSCGRTRCGEATGSVLQPQVNTVTNNLVGFRERCCFFEARLIPQFLPIAERMA